MAENGPVDDKTPKPYRCLRWQITDLIKEEIFSGVRL